MHKFCSNISTLYRFGRFFFNHMLREYEITCGQMMVLMEIHKQSGINQDQVAEKTCFDKGTVARAAAVLEKKGLVKRVVDPANRRAYKLYTTPMLTAIEKELNQAIVQYREVLSNGITEDVCMQTLHSLDIMANNARQYQQNVDV